MNECQRKTFNYLKRVCTSDCQVDVGVRGTKWDIRSLKRLAGGLFDLTGFILMGQVDVSSLWGQLKSNKLLRICWGQHGNLMRENYTSHLSSFLVQNVPKIIILQFEGCLQLYESLCVHVHWNRKEYEPLWGSAHVLYPLLLVVTQLSLIRRGSHFVALLAYGWERTHSTHVGDWSGCLFMPHLRVQVSRLDD